MGAEIIKEQEVEVKKHDLSEQSTGDYTQTTKISPKKDRVEKTRQKISGVFASGTFGGTLQPFSYMERLGGTRVSGVNVKGTITMQPIKHVSFDKLKLKLFIVDVPNSAVWSDSEKFTAQRKDLFVDSILFPTVDVPAQATINDDNGTFVTRFADSTYARDTVGYAYYGNDLTRMVGTTVGKMLFSGYYKAWNEIFRPKNYASPIPFDKVENVTADDIFNGGQASTSVIDVTAILTDPDYINCCVQRISAETNYWNDYRLEVYDNNAPVDNTSLFTHNVTQQMIDEYRSQEANANKTDEQVIAELRGTAVARENIPQVICQHTTDIDLAIQPQTSEGDLRLGEDGALSYTFPDVSMRCNYNHPKDGYIHCFWVISAPDSSITTNGVNIETLKTQWQDFYRPAMAKIKDAPLYKVEVQALAIGETTTDVIGYKRRYSEYGRLPTMIRGDHLATRGWNFAGARHNNGGFNIAVGTGTITSPIDFLDWSFDQLQVMDSNPANPFIRLWLSGSTGIVLPTVPTNTAVIASIRTEWNIGGDVAMRVGFSPFQTSGSRIFLDMTISIENLATLQTWILAGGGITSVLLMQQIAGSQTVTGSIEDKNDFNLLLDEMHINRDTFADNYPVNPQTDYTDVNLMRLMIYSGSLPNAGYQDVRRYKALSNCAFNFYGSIDVICEQPIEREVFTHFIEYGEE